MRRLLWALLGALGCSAKPAPPELTPPTELAPAHAPKEAAVVAPESAAPVAVPRSEPVEEPSISPPTKKQALVASRAVLSGKLAQLAPIVSLSDGRAAVLWRHTKASEAWDVDVELVMLAFDGTTWIAQASRGVTSASTPWLDEDQPPPLAATMKSDDYDDDGEPEVLIRIRYPEMCPGGGPNTITSLDVFDVTPRITAALSTQIHHLMDAYPEEGTKATTEHIDLNGDGHRDVKITYETKGEKPLVNRWLYQPESDTWTLRNPQYERWDCDW
ncbi:MAG: hypothetical protein ACE37F_20925 [Nannocystaceae bacterium]|nr:hypothetical protein [bacterium]